MNSRGLHPGKSAWSSKRAIWTCEIEKGMQTDDKYERIIEQIKHRGVLDAMTMDQEHLYLYLHTSFAEMA